MKKFLPKGPFEAKLQIRPKDPDLIQFIKKELSKTEAEIVDENKLKEGLDIYITSSQIAFKLGKIFRDRYKIKPKITKSLVGENKQLGKRIYRLTVLFKIN